ncbi:flagellar basal body-associated protein FliL [Thalassotalea euphylliae]|uniref:Flagellar protein FliL n=1 Tax=Thalassotalea euphylliae TaxID=1655234 RepID=A0A3E0TKZ2_9GAMM|nr:flagellar basal body-associated protein FliL [Thalassotalea euphylliae]REL25186.1 flagellar basal body-associated protein FliL [Thalassotalea euphylliae]
MKKLSLILVLALASLTAKASDYVYYGFQPDIITNYVAVKKKLGYVRLTVELMIEGSGNLEAVEHHAPLLRDAIINIIGQQSEEKIKSINGRQQIQRECEAKVKELLTQETGQPLIKRLMFTQWLDN